MASSLPFASPPVSKSRRRALQSSAQHAAKASLYGASVFAALALLGALVQIAKHMGGDDVIQNMSAPPRSPQEESLSALAMAATVTAARLWGRVLLAIVIPTSEQSYVYAKEGWSAFEPSLKHSVVWLVYESSAAFKTTLAALGASLVGVVLAEREIRKRRYVERVTDRLLLVKARYNAVTARVVGWYAALRAEVARESQLAASILPHALYIGLALLLNVWLHDSAQGFSRGFLAWAVVVGWPVAASTRHFLLCDTAERPSAATNQGLGQIPEGEEEESSSSMTPEPATPAPAGARGAAPGADLAEAYMARMALAVRKRLMSDADDVRDVQVSLDVKLQDASAEQLAGFVYWLKYWSVLALALLLEQFPVSGHVLGLISVWPQVRLLFAVWLQLPLTGGAELAFVLLRPLLNRYIGKIPDAPVSSAQRSAVLNLLVGAGVLAPRTREHIVEIMDTSGPLILVSLPFLLSPSFVTKIGVLLVGLAFPAHASALAVTLLDQSAPAATGRDATRTAAWLEYWIVYAVFTLLHAALSVLFGWWFPLWDQFHLLALLWLQLPYFRGARRLFALVVVANRVWQRRLLRWRTRRQLEEEPEEPEELPNEAPPSEELPEEAPRTPSVDDAADAPLCEETEEGQRKEE
jgi:hypothetical protein